MISFFGASYALKTGSLTFNLIDYDLHHYDILYITFTEKMILFIFPPFYCTFIQSCSFNVHKRMYYLGVGIHLHTTQTNSSFVKREGNLILRMIL